MKGKDIIELLSPYKNEEIIAIHFKTDNVTELRTADGKNFVVWFKCVE